MFPRRRRINRIWKLGVEVKEKEVWIWITREAVVPQAEAEDIEAEGLQMKTSFVLDLLSSSLQGYINVKMPST